MSRRRFLLLVVLPLAALIGGEVAAERALGGRWQRGLMLRTTWPDVEIREAKRGWAMRPRLEAEVVGTHPPYHVALDQEGYRQERRNKARDTAGLRVLALGDAVVYGWGVEAEERFTDRLERSLTYAIQGHVEVWNLAVPGYSVDQSLWTYELHGRALEPDIVVLYVAMKDIALAETDNFAGLAKPRFLSVDGVWRRQEAPPLTEVSPDLPRLARLSRWSGMLAWWRERGAGPLPGPPVLPDRVPWNEAAARPITLGLAAQAEKVLDPNAPVHQALLALSERVRADGIPLVLLSGPFGYEPYLTDPRFEAPPEGFREAALSRALRRFAEREGAQVVAVDELLGREVARGVMLHVGDGYPNPRAHQLIAEALEPLLLRLWNDGARWMRGR